MKISFFRTRKPRQFEYLPRYYDPEKEKRDERRREILGPEAEEIGGESYVPGKYVNERIKFRRGIGSTLAAKRKKNRLSPLRGLLALVALALLVLWAAGII